MTTAFRSVRFKPPHDGQGPAATMIVFEGTLYGTTVGGGAYDAGTVFKVDPATNKESVVYSFEGGHSNPDGANPSGSLIAVNGHLRNDIRVKAAINEVFARGPDARRLSGPPSRVRARRR